MATENLREFVTLAGYPDYVICTNYPYEIKKNSTWRTVSEWVEKDTGYVSLHLNGKRVRKHRIVATQFIPNPDEFPQVDHINGDKADFHIENLRWCSNKQNCNNKLDDELVYDVPDCTLIVDGYAGWIFEDLYYFDNVFYFWNGIKYKIVKTQQNKNGTYFVHARDITGIQRCIYYPKFKREYGLQ